MSTPINILLVGCNKSWLQTLDTVEGANVWVYDTHSNWRNRSNWTSDLEALRGVELGSLSEASAFSHVLEWARWLKVDAIIPGIDFAVRLASYVADELELAGLGQHAAKALTDKSLLRQLCSGTSINQPKWRVFDGLEQVTQNLATYPAVLKPTNLQASAGVTLIRNKEQFETAKEHAYEAAYESNGAKEAMFLLEELIEGSEFSTEILVSKTKILWTNVTRKHVAQGPWPVEIGHDLPATITTQLKNELDTAIRSLVEVTAVRDGLLHAEWIVRDETPHLIECAGRVPGDFILPMASEAWGFDVYIAVLEILLGNQSGVPVHPQGASSIRYLTPEAGSVVSADLGTVEALPGVIGAELFVSPGDQVEPLRSSWDRCGYIRVVGADLESAVRRVTKYKDTVELQVEPNPNNS